jgi:hypothetical protein
MEKRLKFHISHGVINLVEIPKLFKKPVVEVEPITGYEPEDVQDEPEPDESYEPTELVEEEINDIVDQFLADIKEFNAMNFVKAIPGDKPVNLSKASELCTIALSGSVFQHVLLKQEEADKANAQGWMDLYLNRILITALIILLPAIVFILMYFMTKR